MIKIITLFSFLFALCSLLLAGCVNRQLAESYSQFLDTVGAEYIRYVESDSSLDETDKSIRTGNHDQAVKTVEKFENTKWSW